MPVTPGSEQKKRYEAAVSECRVDMKVVEKLGMLVKSMVQKSDPFQRQYCSDRDNCMVCRVEGSRGRCRQSGVMYKIECSECDHVYFNTGAGYRSRIHFIRNARFHLKCFVWTPWVEFRLGRHLRSGAKLVI